MGSISPLSFPLSFPELLPPAAICMPPARTTHTSPRGDQRYGREAKCTIYDPVHGLAPVSGVNHAMGEPLLSSPCRQLAPPTRPPVYGRACPSRGLPQPESAMTTRPNHPLPRQVFHLQVCPRLKAAGRVERRRDWFRPMASAVSALSSIVANGHQILPSFPPPPLFIP